MEYSDEISFKAISKFSDQVSPVFESPFILQIFGTLKIDVRAVKT